MARFYITTLMTDHWMFLEKEYRFTFQKRIFHIYCCLSFDKLNCSIEEKNSIDVSTQKLFFTGLDRTFIKSFILKTVEFKPLIESQFMF